MCVFFLCWALRKQVRLRFHRAWLSLLYPASRSLLFPSLSVVLPALCFPFLHNVVSFRFHDETVSSVLASSDPQNAQSREPVVSPASRVVALSRHANRVSYVGKMSCLHCIPSFSLSFSASLGWGKLRDTRIFFVFLASLLSAGLLHVSAGARSPSLFSFSDPLLSFRPFESLPPSLSSALDPSSSRSSSLSNSMSRSLLESGDPSLVRSRASPCLRDFLSRFHSSSSSESSLRLQLNVSPSALLTSKFASFLNPPSASVSLCASNMASGSLAKLSACSRCPQPCCGPSRRVVRSFLAPLLSPRVPGRASHALKFLRYGPQKTQTVGMPSSRLPGASLAFMPSPWHIAQTRHTPSPASLCSSSASPRPCPSSFTVCFSLSSPLRLDPARDTRRPRWPFAAVWSFSPSVSTSPASRSSSSRPTPDSSSPCPLSAESSRAPLADALSLSACGDDIGEADEESRTLEEHAFASPFLADACRRGVLAHGNALPRLDQLLTSWTAALLEQEGRKRRVGELESSKMNSNHRCQKTGQPSGERGMPDEQPDAPLSFYLGIDLTGGSLHIGHLLPLLLLRRLQCLQLVRPVLLLGTATTLVGDPTGKFLNFVKSKRLFSSLSAASPKRSSLLDSVLRDLAADARWRAESEEKAEGSRGCMQPNSPQAFCLDVAKAGEVESNRDAIARQLAQLFNLDSASDGVVPALRPEPAETLCSSLSISPPSPPPAAIVENCSWLSGLSSLDFLTEFGAFLSLPRLLSRSSVEETLGPCLFGRGDRSPTRSSSRNKANFSFASLAYAVLQAVDWCFLRRRFGVVGQVGGRDQWGNISTGLELARRRDNLCLFGLTTPLLLNRAGVKMGKSGGGAGTKGTRREGEGERAGGGKEGAMHAKTPGGKTVWLRKDLTPPVEFWRYWRNVDDTDVKRLLRWFTLLSLPEIEALEEDTRHCGAGALNYLKEVLADHVTTLVHGPSVTKAVRAVVTAGRRQSSAPGVSRVDPSGALQGGEVAPANEFDQAKEPSAARLPPTHFLKSSCVGPSQTEARGVGEKPGQLPLSGGVPGVSPESRGTGTHAPEAEDAPPAEHVCLGDGGDTPGSQKRLSLSRLLAGVCLCPSRAAARRLIAQGAVRINGKRIQADGEITLADFEEFVWRPSAAGAAIQEKRDEKQGRGGERADGERGRGTEGEEEVEKEATDEEGRLERHDQQETEQNKENRNEENLEKATQPVHQSVISVGKKGFAVIHLIDDADWPPEKRNDHLLVAE
ncbi:tyrosine-tRNA ligase [Toxoplasma gondii VAND]|uniref:Tyrosyl-tRNA synthetase n=1 Tax=Toxoplasma gondii VAND TaxID=933077 RepID=A0A086QGB2_TOXGO|nr:tyrosine-tRNA ligase [Toxoplasma gondii VAND]